MQWNDHRAESLRGRFIAGVLLLPIAVAAQAVLNLFLLAAIALGGIYSTRCSDLEGVALRTCLDRIHDRQIVVLLAWAVPVGILLGILQRVALRGSHWLTWLASTTALLSGSNLAGYLLATTFHTNAAITMALAQFLLALAGEMALLVRAFRASFPHE